MKLLLERQQSELICTIGSLFVDGEFECFTLEDPVREQQGVPVLNWKVKGDTAIPRGTYEVIITYSNRFKKDLPLLLGVPGFEGVRIHTGNTDADTEGCILVGAEVSGPAVLRSREAFGRLYNKIAASLTAGNAVTITVGDEND